MRMIALVALFAFTVSPAFSADAPISGLLQKVRGRIADIGEPGGKADAAELKELLKARDALEEAEVVLLDVGGADPAHIADYLDVTKTLGVAAAALEKSGTEDVDILDEVSAFQAWCEGFGSWLSDLLQALMPSLTPKDQEKVNAAMKKVSESGQAADEYWNQGEWGASLKSYLKALRGMAKAYAKYSL